MKDENFGLYLWNHWSRPAALSKEESARLLREYHKYGDKEVREKLIYGSLGLVQNCVNQYCKKYVAVDDQINPSLEDLYETATAILIDCIDKFNPDEFSFSFSTYFYHHVQSKLAHVYGNEYRRSVKVETSLNAPEVNPKTGEKSKNDLIDKIPAKNHDLDILHDKLELEYIKREILPLLSKLERDIFFASVIKHKSKDDIAQLFGTNQAAVGRILNDVQEKVKRLYIEGPTALDKQLRGVKLKKDSLDILKKNNETIEKYGREFLRLYFLPILKPEDRTVFEATVLNFRGQSLEEIAQELGKTLSEISHRRIRILKRLENGKIGRQLKNQQNCGNQPSNKRKKSIEQEINRNERFVDQYGGRFFLQKYFVPTLSPTQKRVFECAVLEYDGQTKTELANKSGVSIQNFSTILKTVKEKLVSTNFKVLVDLMDRKFMLKKGERIDSSEKRTDLAQVEKRRHVVEQYGGKDKLIKYFLPILPETQKQIFDLLYLRQAFATLSGVADFLHIQVSNVLAMEKIALQKLANTNLEELEKLDKMTEQYLQAQLSQKLSSSINTTRQDIIANYGGIAFLRDVFLPKMLTNADREIFEGFILDGQPLKNFIYLFSNERQNKKFHYTQEVSLATQILKVSTRVKEVILPQLKNFKASFPDFEKAVKEFYLKRGFEQIHPEDFEKIAFGQAQETFATKLKTFISPELVEKAGGERVVMRKFRPTLSLSHQLVFMKSYVAKMTDEQIAKDMNASTSTIEYAKSSIVKKLETFAENANSKK